MSLDVEGLCSYEISKKLFPEELSVLRVTIFFDI